MNNHDLLVEAGFQIFKPTRRTPRFAYQTSRNTTALNQGVAIGIAEKLEWNNELQDWPLCEE